MAQLFLNAVPTGYAWCSPVLAVRIDEVSSSAVTRPIAVALAALVVGCASNSEVATYPLYEAPSGRLPANEVARLFGPIESVDGEVVEAKGSAFELRPGCHIVRAHAENLPGPRWSETISGGRYALRMKPGFTYRIRHVFGSNMRNRSNPGVRNVAQEEAPTGTVTLVDRIQSQDDVAACKEWERTELAGASSQMSDAGP